MKMPMWDTVNLESVSLGGEHQPVVGRPAEAAAYSRSPVEDPQAEKQKIY